MRPPLSQLLLQWLTPASKSELEPQVGNSILSATLRARLDLAISSAARRLQDLSASTSPSASETKSTRQQALRAARVSFPPKSTRGEIFRIWLTRRVRLSLRVPQWQHQLQRGHWKWSAVVQYLLPLLLPDQQHSCGLLNHECSYPMVFRWRQWCDVWSQMSCFNDGAKYGERIGGFELIREVIIV